MKLIPVGARGSFTPPEVLANRFKDPIQPAVFPNGLMTMLMENAALNAIKPYLTLVKSPLARPSMSVNSRQRWSRTKSWPKPR
jgi:hypothetical protein